ncbi:unnamed protein product, partial [Polarella glacialis]
EDAPALNISPAALQGFAVNVQKWAVPRMNRIRNPGLRPFVKGRMDQASRDPASEPGCYEDTSDRQGSGQSVQAGPIGAKGNDVGPDDRTCFAEAIRSSRKSKAPVGCGPVADKSSRCSSSSSPASTVATTPSALSLAASLTSSSEDSPCSAGVVTSVARSGCYSQMSSFLRKPSTVLKLESALCMPESQTSQFAKNRSYPTLLGAFRRASDGKVEESRKPEGGLPSPLLRSPQQLQLATALGPVPQWHGSGSVQSSDIRPTMPAIQQAEGAQHGPETDRPSRGKLVTGILAAGMHTAIATGRAALGAAAGLAAAGPAPQVGDPNKAEPLESEPVTTLMLRNLPKELTQPGLLEELDRSGFAELYDFVYMPGSFDAKEGKGYAFVNFSTTAAAGALVGAWHRSRRCGVREDAPALNISPAALQGFAVNVQKWAVPRMNRIRNPGLRPFVKGRTDQASRDPASEPGCFLHSADCYSV